MFIKAIAFTLALQTSQVRVVYSYDRHIYDSLEVIVNKNEKSIHKRNYRLLTTDIDSADVGWANKNDTVEVILRAHKKNLWCIPFIDTIKYPFRISYGLNFECIKLVM